MPKPPSDLPDHEVTPNPKLEKRTRRRFSTEYKLRILAEADACQHGELGEVLRRERLYSSQLTTWRKELAESGVEKLHKTAPGPRASKTAEQKRIEALGRGNPGLRSTGGRRLEPGNGGQLLKNRETSQASSTLTDSDGVAEALWRLSDDVPKKVEGRSPDGGAAVAWRAQRTALIRPAG